MTHLQSALDYLNQFPPHTPARAAADGLITLLIENGTFTYADQHEYERYIAPRKVS
ncbi:hypothetical protein I1A62_30160 [Rhodococcus sp. USK10]|uniref:hypothetical protein n=1 Tax=Rhodococcus sp. USK10 TaxID=2789739 RepID=UPI001C5E7A17|nr:hypothetical protein [Rhodococcus sp. USK10]QYB01494.1 hypothetical protein I1A62_30160 [Rhodococcus sp. USK10]